MSAHEETASFSEEEVSPGLTIITVVGELDVATSPELRERLTARGEAGDKLVVVDLRGVSFIDSTTLGVLVGTLKGFLKIGTRFRLVFDQPPLRRLFEITGLDEVFSIFNDLEAALENA